jgi:hypothetical protein
MCYVTLLLLVDAAGIPDTVHYVQACYCTSDLWWTRGEITVLHGIPLFPELHWLPFIWRPGLFLY